LALKKTGVLLGSYLGWQALRGIHHIFSKKNKNLIYSHGDMIRRNLFGMVDPFGLKEAFAELTGLCKSPLSQVASQKIWGKKDALMRKELKSAQQKMDAKAFTKLQSLWNEYKQKEIKDLTQISDWVEIMDYEVLAKIFQSDRKHNIVYAGALHCNGISEILMKHFHFTQIKKSGNDKLGQFIGLKLDIHDELGKLGIKYESRQWEKMCDQRMKVHFPPIHPSVWKELETIPS